MGALRRQAAWVLFVGLAFSTGRVDAAPAPRAYRDGEILVRLKGNARAAASTWARGAMRGSIARSFRRIGGLHLVRLPAGDSVEEAVARAQRDPLVEYAEPNYVLHEDALPDDPRFPSLWGLHNTGQDGGIPDADIDAPEAWDVTTGSSNVVVAVIDTGIDYTHPDLAANMFRNEPDCTANGVDDDGNGFVDDCHGIDTAEDDSDPFSTPDQHGTHVAGTIGATGNDGDGVVGVNWNVRILACKFLHRSSGFTSDAVACLDYLALMKDRGVNVVASNNSWGGPFFSQALRDAIAEQLARGILFVASAGNAGSDLTLFPAGYDLPNVITVAATTRTNQLASFSSFGRTHVHLGAPGQDVLSTGPGGSYLTFSGTSMAAPHVTGVAALLKAADPARDWRALRNLILAGGDPLPALAATTSTGRRLNAHRSLTCANQVVLARQQPRESTVSASPGATIPLEALHIRCASPNGTVAVSVAPGGATITLRDDGLGPDRAAGDGVYSAAWTPAVLGTFTLGFPGGDLVTIHVTVDTLLGPSAAAGDRLGFAMAADGGQVLVGAYADDAAGVDAGAARLFDAATGQHLRAYLPPAPSVGGHFGFAVAMDALRVLVGAPGEDAGAPDAGAAYLFDRGSGALLQSLVSPGPLQADQFGWSVALVGGNVAVGALQCGQTAACRPGTVYLFDGVTGGLLRTFQDPVAPEAGDNFGLSLAGDASTLVIGKPWPSRLTAFVVDAVPGSPGFGSVRRTLQPPPAPVQPVSFGWSVALLGGNVLVGDPFASFDLRVAPGAPRSTGLGSAYLFDGATGQPLATYANPRTGEGSYFAWSVAGHDGFVIVGAPTDDSLGIGAGASFLFATTGGDALRLLSSPNPTALDQLGNAVAAVGIPEPLFFAGTPGDDSAALDAGAVHRLGVPVRQDRYQCHKTKTPPGEDRFTPRSVQLADEFGPVRVTVRGPQDLCPPTSKDGSAIVDPLASLACHRVAVDNREPPFARRDAMVFDGFGTQRLSVVRRRTLCVPTGTGGSPLPAGLDHYQCYRVLRPRDLPRFVKRLVTLADDSGTRVVLVKKPTTLCLPTAVDADEIAVPGNAVLCYLIADTTGTPPFVPSAVSVDNRFGPQALALKKRSALCLPAQRLVP